MARMFMCLQYKVYTASIYIAAVRVGIMCLYYHCQQVGVIMLLILCSLCCGVNCDDTPYSFLVFFFRVRGSFIRIALP